jgi:hypothetical protein
MQVSGDRMKTCVIGNLPYLKIFARENILARKFSFITYLISNYNKNDIKFRFKCIPYLMSVFFFNLLIFSSGVTADGISSSCKSCFANVNDGDVHNHSFHSIHRFTNAIQWFANFKGLKLTQFPTLEGFSIAHV